MSLANTVRRWGASRWLARRSPIDYQGVTVDLSNPAIDDHVRSRFALGTYEPQELRAIERLPAGGAVVDLGAGLGVTAGTLARNHDVLAVEANPDLWPTLYRTSAMNGGFAVVPAAYHPTAEQADVFLHERSIGASVVRETDTAVTVQARSLARLLDGLGGDPLTAVVVDIEGAETDLITAEGELLADAVRWLVVEWHEFAPGVTDAQDRLRELGFERVVEDQPVATYRNQAFRNGEPLRNEGGDGA